jgi:chaperone required for assembly of F1-ATPase
LAEAVAAEWEAQGDTVRPETMPLTQLAATAIDSIEAERAGVIAALVAYGASDLVCYRAAHPLDLAARQDAQWGPLLQWAETTLGVRLAVTRDVFPLPQPQAATEALHGVVAALGTFELAALASIVQISASLVIGLALIKGRLDAETAFSAAMLDEQYQAARWGEDAWASARAAGLRAEVFAAARFLALARPS